MSQSQLFELEEDEELRMEVGDVESVTLILKTGKAEIFGTELVRDHNYKMTPGSKFAVFTFHGCQILIKGEMEVTPYTSKETPMIMYLNIHAALEQCRVAAENNPEERGPVFMVVGPKDVGKSTLCQQLCNYGVRLTRTPIYVDLDVGQGAIGVPGTIGAIMIERPALVNEGFPQNSPLLYHYGHKTPGHNPQLYNQLVSRLADVVRERCADNRKTEVSGMIINTCGWVKNEGYNQIKHIAQAFEAAIIVVLDQERVYNDLVRDMPNFVKVLWLPKSGGVVERNTEQRQESREKRIKQYFYGHANHKKLFPHSFDIKFSELNEKIYKIGAPALPDSCMPLGMKSEDNQTKLVIVNPSNRKELLNHILSVSFATEPEDLLMSNVAGFVCVTGINEKENKLTVLSPQPKPLPANCLLLLSDEQFVDSS